MTTISKSDRHGNPVGIGARVRMQECAGRYGQTRIISGTITNINQWNGVELNLDADTTPFVEYSKFGRTEYRLGSNYYIPSVFQNGIGYRKHDDVEHGHETWLEVIK